MNKTRGFVVVAQNTTHTDYVKCAKALAVSLKRVMPNESITLITSDSVDASTAALFDSVVSLPYGDLTPTSPWKLSNDWQVYEASPYDYTIKLEADIFLPRSIEHWWDVLSKRDVVVANTIRNFKGEVSDCRVYRKFIDENALPDCYNAITYFNKSETAAEFFAIVRNVFENWADYKAILKCNPSEEVTTDWVYALACHIMGVEKTMLPGFTEFSMTHMKQYVNGLPTEDWDNTLVYECLPETLRIHTYTQSYPLHYHTKNFADIILERYLCPTP
jgi:hypothetical protein